MVLFSRVFNELQASRYSGLATCHDFPKYDYGHLFINRLHLGIAKQLVPALDTGTPLKPRHPFYSILILIARENSWEKWCGDHVHHVPSSQLETQHSPLHVSNAIRHEANPQNDHAFFGNTVKFCLHDGHDTSRVALKTSAVRSVPFMFVSFVQTSASYLIPIIIHQNSQAIHCFLTNSWGKNVYNNYYRLCHRDYNIDEQGVRQHWKQLGIRVP